MVAWRKTHSRGFFFTVMALAMLLMMLMSVQVWVRTFEQHDLRATQKFKGEAVRLSLSTLSDEALSRFANASAFYATYRLANFTSQPGQALVQSGGDTSNPQTARVPQVIFELMMNGSSRPIDGNNAEIAYSSDEKQAYSIRSWLGSITQAASVMGLNASFSQPENFSFQQASPWELNVQFQIRMNVSDLEGSMGQRKTLRANATFPIDGIMDPFIRREDAQQRCDNGAICTDFAERQFFRHAQYNLSGDLRPVKLKENPDVKMGYGWFYGPVEENYPTEWNDTDKVARLSQYILVRSYDANMTQYADSFGAVILTNLPNITNYVYSSGSSDPGCEYNVTMETNCLNCLITYTRLNPSCPEIPDQKYNNITVPYMAVSGSGWLSSVPTISLAGVSESKYVLMDNEFLNPSDMRVPGAYHRIWDITRLRDAAICGFYVKSDKGPSFFQRMVQNSQTLKSPSYGLETFVVGKWAGGADDRNGNHPLHSRLDWEFYTPVVGNTDNDAPRILGMPGCRSFKMCSSDPNTTMLGTGVFRIGDDSAGRYGLDDLKCTLQHCGNPS